MQVLISAKSYDEAVAMLETAPVTAPVYYITAGSLPDQGAVLTRDRNSLADLVTLNATDLQQGPVDTWYLLQTNYVSPCTFISEKHCMVKVLCCN